MTEVAQYELARRTVCDLDRRAGLGVDQLGVDEAPSAEMHPILFLALAPKGYADVADAHRLGDLRTPALLELRAERRLASARLAGNQHARHARPPKVDVSLGSPLDEVGSVGRRQHDGVGPEELDREHQALGATRPERNVRESDALERGESRPGDERAGVVRRDDPLARGDAGSGVAPRRAAH